ncbi:peptidylprolyl isomerase [Candidatus Woesearchaeota archaeon]|nr:MAG: peptidylprolyl isomerase [Candidatus Woesearchaeota archaeon]
MASVKKGDVVKVHYVGTFEDGAVFDSSEGKEPLEIEVGAGKVIKGFDDALVGMDVGQVKEVTIASQDAYGDTNPQLIQKVPRKAFGDQEVKEGMMFAVQAPSGQQIPAVIKDVGADEVTVDLNHPLAGKTLKFKITLVEIKA